MKTRMGLRIREMQVGRTKLMSEAGYSVAEIAEELKIDESTVRGYMAVIEKAERNKSELQG